MHRLYVSPILFFLLIAAGPSHAQKNLLSDYDAVVNQARAELDSMMLPQGRLQAAAAKEGIRGTYVFDVTLYEKGKVLSVFLLSGDSDNLAMQNNAKDLVRTALFSFKMPPGKKYKLQYTFHFG